LEEYLGQMHANGITQVNSEDLPDNIKEIIKGAGNIKSIKYYVA